jgi:2'-5' RNA ligase
MGSDENGIPGSVPAEEQLNVFALVIYVPEPLGRFLDDLRRELAPGSNPHAHVSVLPPRPLAVDWQAASGQARALTERWAPFEIELTGLEIFPVTNVIYLEIGAGAADLRRMHAAMNAGALEFREPFPYHPHITLAQEIPPQEVRPSTNSPSRRWQEYGGGGVFRAERTVFVRNTLDNCWRDLAEYSLGAVAVG